MSKKMGQTHDRSKAIISDCIRKIARDNYSHNEWCRYAVEQYDITTRRAEQMWSEAWSQIKDKFAADAEANLMQALMRLDDLYIQTTEQGGDWNTRNNILRERHKLMGLGVEKHEVKSTINLSFDFSSDDEK
jgi:hypothetical protein